MSDARSVRRCSLALSIAAYLALSAGSALGGSVSYTYDSLGRLKTVTYSNGVVINYNYDPAGNRTSVVVAINSGE